MAKSKVPGTFYQRNGRWWWKVRLPGESGNTQIPLKPRGAKFATRDKAVAECIARDKWNEALRSHSKARNDPLSIADFIRLYNGYAKVYYRYTDGLPTPEANKIELALQYLNDFCGMLEPESFGPLKLQGFRQTLIERNLSRKYINDLTGIVKRMFRWAVSKELISEGVYRALTTVDNLRPGRSQAKETKKIKPVPESHVYAILPYTSKVIRAMVQLQLLTGMRSTELCIMRPCDIETSGKIWLYRPINHKNAWRQHDRQVAIGPRGKELLRPYLNRKITDYCFKPEESLKQREGGGKAIRDHYDRSSYRKAVQYAIVSANNDGKKIPFWTPHQLRHSFATFARREMGVEAAGTAIGDVSIDVVRLYAERNLELACKVAEKIG